MWVIIGTLLLMSVIILVGVVLGFRKNRGDGSIGADDSGITVTKWANKTSVTSGEPIKYTIQITNSTDNDITGTFTDITEGSTELQKVSEHVKDVNLTADKKTLTGTVNVPAKKTITVTVDALAEDYTDVDPIITNTAYFKNADYNVSSDPTTVVVIAQPYPVS
jgi:uncharacterized repeat protein (TIGR01451 family)